MIVQLDVSTPSSAHVLDRFGGAIGRIEQLALRGRHLFVQAGSSTAQLGGVYVFDVSESPPALVGQYLADLIDPGFHVTSTGRVFLARTPASEADSAKIDIVDMADPRAPTLLATWPAVRPLNIVDIDVQEGKAYCAGYWGGIFVLGGADKAQLAVEAEFDWNEMPSFAASSAVAPPYVFVARGETRGTAGSFQAFRHDGSALSLAWEQAAALPVHSVAVAGNLLVTVELEPPRTTDPQKVLKLYRIFDD